MEVYRRTVLVEIGDGEMYETDWVGSDSAVVTGLSNVLFCVKFR